LRQWGENLNATIASIKGFIKNNLIDADLAKKIIDGITKNIKEIGKLESSDQIYRVTSIDGGSGAKYEEKTGKVLIEVSKEANVSLVGHELKHGYQYETGEISLKVDNLDYGVLYDIGDETQANNVEMMISGGKKYYEDRKNMEWTNKQTLNKGKAMTPPAYQGLPNGPININSKEGKALRQRTVEAGKAGRAVTEVYYGWQTDYSKGVNSK